MRQCATTIQAVILAVTFLLIASLDAQAARRLRVVQPCASCVRPVQLQAVAAPRIVANINHAATLAYATPAVSAYSPVVSYSVPPQVRQEAVDTHDWRHSPEWQAAHDELLQLRAWKAGVESVRQHAQAIGEYARQEMPQPEQPQPPIEPLPQPDVPQAGDPGPVPDVAEIPDSFHPTINALCAGCHNGGNPEATTAMRIGPDTLLRSEVAASDTLAILRAVYNGRMPKTPDGNSKPVDDEIYSRIQAELLSEDIRNITW